MVNEVIVKFVITDGYYFFFFFLFWKFFHFRNALGDVGKFLPAKCIYNWSVVN